MSMKLDDSIFCNRYITDSAPIPCPTCSTMAFCSLKCRAAALGSYHAYECRMAGLLKETGLDQMSLILMVLRAIAQKPLSFFREAEQRGDFSSHNLKNGVGDDDGLFLSADYKNLFNLISHEERREKPDVAAKTVFAVFLGLSLKYAGYFEKDSRDDEVLVCRLLFHFLQCFQFNSHMVECIYENRLIAVDAETRIWKEAR